MVAERTLNCNTTDILTLELGDSGRYAMGGGSTMTSTGPEQGWSRPVAAKARFGRLPNEEALLGNCIWLRLLRSQR